MSCVVVSGSLFFLEISFKLIIAADINYQYLIDYMHEKYIILYLFYSLIPSLFFI